MKKFKEVLLESLKIAGTLLYYVVILLCFSCVVYTAFDLVLNSRWLEIVCYVMIFANVWGLCDEFSKLGSKISIQAQFIISSLILFVYLFGVFNAKHNIKDKNFIIPHNIEWVTETDSTYIIKK